MAHFCHQRFCSSLTSGFLYSFALHKLATFELGVKCLSYSGHIWSSLEKLVVPDYLVSKTYVITMWAPLPTSPAIGGNTPLQITLEAKH